MYLLVFHGLIFLMIKGNNYIINSEKYMFIGYYNDIKVYKLTQFHFYEIIIRRDVKIDENLLSYKPNLVVVPSFV